MADDHEGQLAAGLDQLPVEKLPVCAIYIAVIALPAQHVLRIFFSCSRFYTAINKCSGKKGGLKTIQISAAIKSALSARLLFLMRSIT